MFYKPLSPQISYNINILINELNVKFITINTSNQNQSTYSLTNYSILDIFKLVTISQYSG